MDKDQSQKRPSLRLTNDFVFKTLFTYYPKAGKRIIEDFSQELTQSPVKTVNYAASEMFSPVAKGKDIRLDVSAHLIPRAYINLEMQATKMQIENRALYYGSMLLTQQENKGLFYSELIPVIPVFLLDYPFPPKQHLPHKAIHAYQFQEIDEHDCLTKLMTLYIIELNKIIQMKHSYEDLKGVEKWCYFIKKYDDEISDPLVAELIRRHPYLRRRVKL